MTGGPGLGSGFGSYEYGFSFLEKNPNKKSNRYSNVVKLNYHQFKIVYHISNHFLMKLNTNLFTGTNLKLNVEVTLSGKSINDDLTKIVNKVWLPALRDSDVRKWIHAVGIVPYRILKNSKNPVILKFSNTNPQLYGCPIYISFDRKERKNVYYWVSKVDDDNTKTHEEQERFKYDPNVYFFSVKQSEHSDTGVLNSGLSTLIEPFLKSYYADRRRSSHDEFVIKMPRMIEQDVPRDLDQVKVYKEMREVQTLQIAENDGRYNEDQMKPIEVLPNTYEYQDRKPNLYRDGVQRLKPGYRYKPFHIEKLTENPEELRQDYERKYSAVLGSTSSPWDDQNQNKNSSEVHLAKSQTFNSKMDMNEMVHYQDLMKQWFFRIYGNIIMDKYQKKIKIKISTGDEKNYKKRKRNTPKEEEDEGLQKLQKQPPRKKRKFGNQQEKKNFKRFTHDPITIEELEFLDFHYDLVFKFNRRPNIIRPSIKELDPLFLSGAISEETFAKANTDIFGIQINPISKEKYLEGLSKDRGDDFQLKMQSNQFEFQLKMQDKQMKLQKQQQQQQQQKKTVGNKTSKTSGSTSQSLKLGRVKGTTTTTTTTTRRRKKKEKSYLLNKPKSKDGLSSRGRISHK